MSGAAMAPAIGADGAGAAAGAFLSGAGAAAGGGDPAGALGVAGGDLPRAHAPDAAPRQSAAASTATAGSPRSGRVIREGLRVHDGELAVDDLVHGGESPLVLPAHRAALGEELHAVALHGAAIGDVGLPRRLGERIRRPPAVLLDGAR